MIAEVCTFLMGEKCQVCGCNIHYFRLRHMVRPAEGTGWHLLTWHLLTFD